MVVMVVMWMHVVWMQVMPCLLLLLAATGCRRAPRVSCDQLTLFLDPLFEMHFCVPFLLVASRKLPSTCIALKRFLSCMRSDVCCKVIGSGERSHANPTLKWFQSCMDPNVTCQLVWPGEPPIAVLNWACIRSLVYWRLTRSVWILPGFHWYQLERHWRLLVHLRQDLVTFTCGRVVFRKLHRETSSMLLLFLSLLLHFTNTTPCTPATARCPTTTPRTGTEWLLLGNKSWRSRNSHPSAVAAHNLCVQPLILRCWGHEGLPHPAVCQLLLLLNVSNRWNSSPAATGVSCRLFECQVATESTLKAESHQVFLLLLLLLLLLLRSVIVVTPSGTGTRRGVLLLRWGCWLGMLRLLLAEETKQGREYCFVWEYPMVDALSCRWGSSEACAKAGDTSARVWAHTSGNGTLTGGSSKDAAVADFARSGISSSVGHTSWGRVHDDATCVAGVLAQVRTDSGAGCSDSRTKAGFVLCGKVYYSFRFRLRRTANRATSGVQGQLLRVQRTCNSVPLFRSASTFSRRRQLAFSTNLFAFLFPVRTVKSPVTWHFLAMEHLTLHWSTFGLFLLS